MDFDVAAVGYKGWVFVDALSNKGSKPNRLFSYRQKPGDPNFANLAAFARENGVLFIESKRPSLDPGVETFFVGWQFLVEDLGSAIVFHDSLLPRYRGFAPTVTALIAGDTELGVTALRPVPEADAGPVLAQRRTDFVPPVKIGHALERQSQMMADIAGELIARIEGGTALPEREQNHALATYSIWRDKADYRLDFDWDAAKLVRAVYALGEPYDGAFFTLDGRVVRVAEARETDEIPLAQRDVGKVWRIGEDSLEVICGQGMLELSALTDEEGNAWIPPRLRCRLNS